ncbi:hypothetical protein J6590_072566 [Homalodisca vitripennis]|nr:hypothetical protein J6590_072566 [Homalodisca vitripennis]
MSTGNDVEFLSWWSLSLPTALSDENTKLNSNEPRSKIIDLIRIVRGHMFYVIPFRIS